MSNYHSQSGKFLAVIAENMPCISGDDMQYWIENKVALKDALVVFDRKIKSGVAPTGRYPVQSKHKSLQEAIAAGKYDSVNDYITAEHFKLEGEIVVDTELVLYHPDRSIQSDDVVKELDQMGLRPATLQELCAFGEKYLDIQREFPIVALGSVCVHSCGLWIVPCLGGRDARRGLSLGFWDVEWDLLCRFLAARK